MIIRDFAIFASMMIPTIILVVAIAATVIGL